MRTIIDLPDAQIAQLAEYCRRERISRAEAIRRAVASLLIRHNLERSQCESDLEAAFGAWKHKDIDGVEYQRSMRAEWDR